MSEDTKKLEVMITSLASDMKAGFEEVGKRFDQQGARTDALIMGLAEAVSNGFEQVEDDFKEVRKTLDLLENVRNPF